MDELKPCPFCGGKAEWIYRDWNPDTEEGDDGCGWVKCMNPECSVEIFDCLIEDAVERWNKRHEPTL